MSEIPGTDQLLADADWLRRLAVALAGSSDADDLVQETRVAALRRAPEDDRPIRPWLAKVIRDVAGMRRRAETRRLAREQAYEPQAPAAPDELLEQMRLHRLLVDLVMELDEPYRSTVIARFVEGRSAAAIARTAGIPESTVRGRLREALARLRTGLDAERGDRKAWAPAVLAFAKGGAQVAKPTKSILIVVALLALLLGLLVVGLRWRETPDVTRRDVVAASQLGTGPRVAPPSRDALDLLVASGRAPGWMVQPGAPSRRLAGIVLVDGVPTAGVLVRVTSELSLTGLVPVLEQRSDAAGRFDFGPQLAREVLVSAAAPQRLAAIQPIDLRDPKVRSDQIELSLASCVVALFGKTIDASGGPVGHARLLREDAIGSESDAQGNYELCVPPSAAQVEQLRIVVRAHGYGAISVITAPVGRMQHDFILTPEATITGRAVLTDGTPVPHAKIWAEADDAVGRPDEQTARVLAVTDDQGRFKLLGVAGGRVRLGGDGRGMTATPVIVIVTAGESKDVTLQMVADGIVRGRVVRDGQPVAGARVATISERSSSAVSQVDGTFVLDRVPAGEVRFVAPPYRVREPASVRVVSGENAVTLEVEALGSVRGIVRQAGKPISDAVVRVHGPTRHVVTADAAGRFALDGLATGDYRLYAHDTRLGASTMNVTFSLAPAETRTLDVELVVDARIAGAVVDAKGSPVAHAYVELESVQGDLGRCIADGRGLFDCGRMLGVGRYTPSVYASPGNAIPFPMVGPTAPIELVGATARVDGIRLVVDATRVAIAGTVVDPDGEPIADARVRALTDNLGGDHWIPSPRSLTGLDGTFRITDLAPGHYQLEVRTRDGSTSVHPKIAAGVTGVRLVVGPTCAHVPAPPEPRTKPAGRVVFDDSIELLGWTVPEKVAVGEEFTITFAYKVLRQLDRSWKIFVHIKGTEPRQWFNYDHDPMDGRCPTALWKPGDLIVDRFTAKVESRGTYQVWTGFFVGSFGRWRNLTVTEAPAELRDSDDRLRIHAFSL